jgi:hypothetical protein
MYSCYGWFDEFDDYCYYHCPYSYECEMIAYEYDLDDYWDYYDEYWF